MAILRNRPLFSAALLYIICAYFGYFSDFRNKVFWCVIGLLALGAFVLLCVLRKLSRRTALVAGLCTVAAVLSLCTSLAVFGPAQHKYEQYAAAESCEVVATVTERSASSEITIYRVRVQEIDGKADGFDAQLVCNFTSYLQVGHQFCATVAPATFSDEGGGFYSKTQAFADGLFMELTCEDENDVTLLGKNDTLPTVALGNLNRSLTRTLQSLCGEDAGSLAAALLLGNKSGLSGEIKRDFSRAGASHMLALSGLHVSILIGALGWLLSKLRVHRRARAVFLAAASIGYLLLTGVSVSATRAVVMVCILQISHLLASDNDTLTTLAVTGAGILICNPYAVCDAGFCLSFLATFGIVALVPPMHRHLEAVCERIAVPPRAKLKARLAGTASAIIEALLVGVIACFAIAVPSCFLIGSMSALSPLTTLLISPMVSGILICAALALILSPIPYLSDFFATLIRLFVRLTFSYTERVSAMDGVLMPLTHPILQALCIALCLGMAVLLVIKLKRLGWLALPPALLLVCLCVFYPINHAWQTQHLRVSYTHPSSRSEAVVTADGYRAFVLDLSQGTTESVHRAIDAASALHATEIGAIVLTDLVPSHCASLEYLFSSYKTDTVYLPLGLSGKDADTRAHVSEIAKRHGVAVIDYEYGTPIELYDGTVLTVHRTDIARSEQPVLVATLERGEAQVSVVSAVAQHTSLAQIAADAVASADLLICPDRGPTPRLTYGYAVAKDTEVVFAGDKIASYCDPGSIKNAKSRVIAPEFLEFCLASQP